MPLSLTTVYNKPLPSLTSTEMLYCFLIVPVFISSFYILNMALDLSKRNSAQIALDLFHICLSRQVSKLDRKELCIGCFFENQSQDSHECVDWPEKDLFFGNKHRAYGTMELIDRLELFGEYFNLVGLYDDHVKLEASKLIATAPVLCIQSLEAARLAVTKFYDDKVTDLYVSMPESFSRATQVLPVTSTPSKEGRKLSLSFTPLSPIKPTEDNRDMVIDP